MMWLARARWLVAKVVGGLKDILARVRHSRDTYVYILYKIETEKY